MHAVEAATGYRALELRRQELVRPHGQALIARIRFVIIVSDHCRQLPVPVPPALPRVAPRP
jgi:hypothetical protein